MSKDIAKKYQNIYLKNIWEKIAENISKKISKNISKRISKNISKNIWKSISKNMSKRISKDIFVKLKKENLFQKINYIFTFFKPNQINIKSNLII